MSKIICVSASDVGIEPAIIKGLETHGVCYFLWPESLAVGAQCAHCHAIVWVNGRKNKVLNDSVGKTSSITDASYKRFRQQTIQSFLTSIPNCPECGLSNFDRFITNTSFPRLADGFDFDPEENSEIEKADSKLKVYWLDE
ncbi:MAG: hypothetical protein MI808_09320 [Pseudomonadales bacterium]|nr:hypothetical protein [Pseudomonadales bacterium]